MTGFLRIQAVADRLGVSVKTVRRALKDPTAPLPSYCIGRKLRVIAERELEAWITARRVVALPASIEPEVRDFLGDLLQPTCNRGGGRRGKSKSGAAKLPTGPLICSQLPARNEDRRGR